MIVPSKDFIDLLKEEAARRLGVDREQLNVQFDSFFYDGKEKDFITHGQIIFVLSAYITGWDRDQYKGGVLIYSRNGHENLEIVIKHERGINCFLDNLLGYEDDYADAVHFNVLKFIRK